MNVCQLIEQKHSGYSYSVFAFNVNLLTASPDAIRRYNVTPPEYPTAFVPHICDAINLFPRQDSSIHHTHFATCPFPNSVEPRMFLSMLPTLRSTYKIPNGPPVAKADPAPTNNPVPIAVREE